MEPSSTVGGNENQYSHYGEQCGDSLKNLEIELPYDPAILLLGIHTGETRIERYTCTPMFITALFIIARTWKQPRCPSSDEWKRKLWYIYTMEYYSAIKKDTFESVLMMKLEPIIQSEVVWFSSVAQSCPTLCDTMNCMQHARPPCPSPTPGVYSNSCPQSR